jgi:HEAT repeat protein
MREIPPAPPAAPPPVRPDVPPGSAPPTHDVLVAQLRNIDGEVRIAAARELGRRGDPLAVPSLVAALRDPHAPVRIAAAHALGKLRDERAIEALGGAMSGDADVNVQAAARGALQAIGTPAADAVIADIDARREQAEREAYARANPTVDRTRGINGLLDAFRGPHERLHAEAADALAEAGPAAVDPLAALLKDDSVWLRKRTAELLGRIGDARAAEPLQAALDAIPAEDRSYETYQFRDAARRALAAVAPSAPPAPAEAPLASDDLSRVAASRIEVAAPANGAAPSAAPQAEAAGASSSAPPDPALAQLSDDQLGERLLEIARAALGGGRPPLDSFDARRDAARSIGEEFNRRGGLDAMRNALDRYVGNLPGRHPIDQAWDGVGEWMG